MHLTRHMQVKPGTATFRTQPLIKCLLVVDMKPRGGGMGMQAQDRDLVQGLVFEMAYP